MKKISNYSLSDLEVVENENGTFSVVSKKHNARLTYNQSIGKYSKGQDEFTRFKANNILNHLTDLDYKDCIDLIA